MRGFSVRKFIRKHFLVLIEYKLPILSGVFIGTSHVPFPPWATLFCFVPLWIFWIREKSLKKIFIAGWWTQFVLSLIGFSWVYHTIRTFGGLPVIPSWIGFLLFCSLFHLYIPIAGLIWGWIRKKSGDFNFKGLWFLLPAFLVLGELTFPNLFPWNHAYSWIHMGFPIVQLGEIIGFQGLSALFVFYNLFFLFIWKLWKKKITKNSKYRAILFLILILTVFSYLNYLGVVKKRSLQKPDASAKVLMVQGNLGGNLRKKYGRNYQDYVFREYKELTREALQHYSNLGIDFVVWPEVAVQDVISSLSQKKERGWRIKRIKKKKKNFSKESLLESVQKFLGGESKDKTRVKKEEMSLFSYPESRRVRSLRRFLRENKIALITGAFGKSSVTSSLANGFFLIGRDGENTDTPYFKTYLLAFGEYLPGSKWFPVLRKWLPQVGDYQRGTGPKVKNLEGFKIGPQICYESLFPFFSIDLAWEGAQIIVNLTNDSWYSVYQEPYQHLYLAAARAIELRRPLIRATNTGISTVVKANGDFLQRFSARTKKWALYDVPFYKNQKPTFYQRFPYLIHFFIFFYLSILFLLFSIRFYRKPLLLNKVSEKSRPKKGLGKKKEKGEVSQKQSPVKSPAEEDKQKIKEEKKDGKEEKNREVKKEDSSTQGGDREKKEEEKREEKREENKVEESGEKKDQNSEERGIKKEEETQKKEKKGERVEKEKAEEPKRDQNEKEEKIEVEGQTKDRDGKEEGGEKEGGEEEKKGEKGEKEGEEDGKEGRGGKKDRNSEEREEKKGEDN